MQNYPNSPFINFADSELDFPTVAHDEFEGAPLTGRRRSAADVLEDDMAAGRVPDGAVIRYTRRFRGNRTLYTYAAVHISGQWYTTSKADRIPGVYTHESFMEALRDDSVVSVEVASDFTSVSAPEPAVSYWA